MFSLAYRAQGKRKQRTLVTTMKYTGPASAPAADGTAAAPSTARSADPPVMDLILTLDAATLVGGPQVAPPAAEDDDDLELDEDDLEIPPPTAAKSNYTPNYTASSSAFADFDAAFSAPAPPPPAATLISAPPPPPPPASTAATVVGGDDLLILD